MRADPSKASARQQRDAALRPKIQKVWDDNWKVYGVRKAWRQLCRESEAAARGRMVWQASSGYNQRSRGETLMDRWKTVIGSKLKARTFENQKTEVKIGARILDRMTELGRPNFERTA